MLFRLAVLSLAAFGGKTLYDRYVNPQIHSGGSGGGFGGNTGGSWASSSASTPTARDTATGTDPNAKYSEPGYQDKSLGQAVAQDEQLVDRLMNETGGNVSAAEQRFSTESAGAPALAHQEPRNS
jgi:hypothetical protein